MISQPKYLIKNNKSGIDQNDCHFLLDNFKNEQRLDASFDQIDDTSLYLFLVGESGKIHCFKDIDKYGLSKYQTIPFRNSSSAMVTSFDLNMKQHLFQVYNEGNVFELCICYFDGVLEILELVIEEQESESYQLCLLLKKQLNTPRMYVNSVQFSHKEFICLGSDEEMEIYEKSFY